MTRGNHETVNMNTMYGFDGECKAKYNAGMIPLFTEIYNWLPLAHVIGKKVFVRARAGYPKDGDCGAGGPPCRGRFARAVRSCTAGCAARTA